MVIRNILALLGIASYLTAQCPPPPNYHKLGILGRVQNATAFNNGQIAENTIVSGVSGFTDHLVLYAGPNIGNTIGVGGKILIQASYYIGAGEFITYNLQNSAFYTITPTVNESYSLPNCYLDRELLFNNPSMIMTFQFSKPVHGCIWWASQQDPELSTNLALHTVVTSEERVPNNPALVGIPVSYQPFIRVYQPNGQAKWVCGDETIFWINSMAL